MEMVEIIKFFSNFGAIGIIAYFFITNANKEREQNNKNFQILFESMIHNNTANINVLKDSMDKLKEGIENSVRYYDGSISVLSQELLKLKQELIDTNTKIVELIIDGKVLNDETFFQLTTLIIEKYIYTLTLTITSYLDNNSFLDESNISDLRDFITTQFDVHKNKTRQYITKINYSTSIVSKIEKITELSFIKYSNDIENEILVPLGITDMMRDGNFKSLKKRINNKLLSLLQDVITYIETKLD